MSTKQKLGTAPAKRTGRPIKEARKGRRYQIGVIVTGRMIAYNWFDCDMPPPSIIVQLAGCTPDTR